MGQLNHLGETIHIGKVVSKHLKPITPKLLKDYYIVLAYLFESVIIQNYG